MHAAQGFVALHHFWEGVQRRPEQAMAGSEALSRLRAEPAAANHGPEALRHEPSASGGVP